MPADVSNDHQNHSTFRKVVGKAVSWCQDRKRQAKIMDMVKMPVILCHVVGNADLASLNV